MIQGFRVNIESKKQRETVDKKTIYYRNTTKDLHDTAFTLSYYHL